MRRIAFVVIALFLSDLSGAKPAAADVIDVQVCDAQYPCDVEGNVLPQYDTGACADVYQQFCSKMTPQTDTVAAMQRQVVQCRISRRNLKIALRKKDQIIAYYHRKVNQLQNQIDRSTH